jgi:hypothetical protein
MKKVILEQIELGDSGELSKEKINMNNEKLNEAIAVVIDEVVKWSEVSDTLGSSLKKVPSEAAVSLALDDYAKKMDVTIGMINKGSVPAVSDLPSDAERGDAYMVESDGYIYQYDGTEWNKTIFTAFPADMLTKKNAGETIDVEFTGWGFWDDNMQQWRSSSQTRATDYIDIVKYLNKVRITARTLGPVSSVVTGWNENKEFVEVVLIGGEYHDFDVEVTNPDIRYIRISSNSELNIPPFSGYKVGVFDKLQLATLDNLGTAINEVRQETKDYTDDSIEALGEVLTTDNLSKGIPVEFSLWGFWDDNMQQWRSSSQTRATDYIDITQYLNRVLITARMQGTVASVVTGWDENKEFVSVLVPGGEYHDIEVSATDPRIKYIRVSSNTELNDPPFTGYSVQVYDKLQLATVEYVESKISGGTNAYVNVKEYGAVGDGFNDDTEAIETAVEAAMALNKSLYFPQGTYSIRRSITLWTDCEIYGYQATIVKRAAATSRTTTITAENQEYVDLDSVAGFNLGDQIEIMWAGFTQYAARYTTPALVTSVDTANKRLYFTGIYDSIKKGALQEYGIGCYVSSSFAILRSWANTSCDNAHIHDLTLDGNRQMDEKPDWCNSCIHIEADSGTVNGIDYTGTSKNIVVRDMSIKNSPFDGISDQGSGNILIESCLIENSYMHGVHFGSGYFDNAKVTNCTVRNARNGAGVFWCSSANGIIVTGNFFDTCNKGCSSVEYATPPQNSIISSNIFKNILSVICDFQHAQGAYSGYGGLVISGNIIIGLNAELAKVGYLQDILIANNLIRTITTTPEYLITAADVTKLIVTGNMSPANTGYVNSSGVTVYKSMANSWDE